MSVQMTTRPELLIVIPAHEESPAKSPSEVMKRFLEAKSPKTPEDIKAECAKADLKAAALREVHLDAVKKRAQRDLERVREAERRRLRTEAAEKQKILERLSHHDKKAEALKEAAEVQAAEKRARREALREAFFASRASMAAATHQREHQLAERLGNAHAKKQKLLQATVHRANYEVKHALAVATAAKEKERVHKERASASLDDKLAAATSRRLDLLGASAGSPGKEGAKQRARQVAAVLNEEAIALEQKRAALAAAMERAWNARNARLEATVHRATAYKDKAARAQAVLEARQAGVADLAHQIVDKGQAASVRRALHLRALHKRSPVAFDVPLEPRASSTPPAALVARLSRNRTLLPSELHARLAGAIARRERVLFDRLSALAHLSDRLERAAARRTAVQVARSAKLAAQAATAATRIALAKATRTRFALFAAERMRAAQAKRTTARDATLCRLRTADRKIDEASVRRALLLYRFAGKAQRQRARAVAFKREAARLAAATRYEASVDRGAAAAARREKYLSERVARAKMSALPRKTAVKLSATADDEAEPEEAVVPDVVEDKLTADTGVLGRLWRKVFGFW